MNIDRMHLLTTKRDLNNLFEKDNAMKFSLSLSKPKATFEAAGKEAATDEVELFYCLFISKKYTKIHK